MRPNMVTHLSLIESLRREGTKAALTIGTKRSMSAACLPRPWPPWPPCDPRALHKDAPQLGVGRRLGFFLKLMAATARRTSSYHLRLASSSISIRLASSSTSIWARRAFSLSASICSRMRMSSGFVRSRSASAPPAHASRFPIRPNCEFELVGHVSPPPRGWA